MNSQSSQNAVLFSEGKSEYRVSKSGSSSPYETKAADIIKEYLRRAGGVHFQEEDRSNSITLTDVEDQLPEESFNIRSEGQNMIIEGNRKGVIYGAYAFVEKFLRCRKFAPGEDAFCPMVQTVKIPLPLNIREAPAFGFREVYSQAETDAEYMDWHRLHNLEELWGIWGHSFYKLVPTTHFKTNPEYFAYYRGRRHPTQLCLSNPHVLEIASQTLEKSFRKNPGAKYWSISPNDNNGYCECKLCREAYRKEGGKQGSLLMFVNRVARKYPQKTFTTLAYSATSKSTEQLVPERNVIIMLSNIEAYRTVPIENEPSAARFRQNLHDWKSKTDRIIIWDYYTQFTNFLAPFPVESTFKPNLEYYNSNEISGVFAQLQGSTYGDLSELKTYLLAKLLWNPKANAEDLTDDFLGGYYKEAGHIVKEFLGLRHRMLYLSQTRLDIYGNPINNAEDFLSPNNLAALNSILDEAQLLANEETLPRINKLRLTLEYTSLQQLKRSGLYQQTTVSQEHGNRVVREEFRKRIDRFKQHAVSAGVKVLSEGGMSPMEYWNEWNLILDQPMKVNAAAGAKVSLKHSFTPEYPAKGLTTLTDGIPGYNDFSYNWLLFYGKPMVATVDLGRVINVKEIEMTFLEDQRHWIIRPKKIKVEYSLDGTTFRASAIRNFESPKENTTIRKFSTRFKDIGADARYIRITTDNHIKLPSFIASGQKKPTIACDEIWVSE